MTTTRLDDTALLDVLETADARACGEQLARLLDPAGSSLAGRDAALLSLHRERYGDRLQAVGRCPSCGEELEVEFPVDGLIPAADEETGGVETAGYELEFRLPSAEDVRAAADERQLAESCVTSARRSADGVSIHPSALPAAVLGAMEERMATLHPAGDVRLAVDCPGCDHEWQERLEVGAFVAARARADALRVVGEVHALAAAYGWSEEQVLALPRARRRRYLELVLG